MPILDYIGNTPLFKIPNLIAEASCPIYVKLEEFNPGGSVKTRAGFAMVFSAHRRNLIKDKTILEPTGGNTGIGITLAAQRFGLKVKLVIPDNFSQEKRKTLMSYGADIILSDHKTGPGSHIRLANTILKEEKGFLCLDQFSNPANPRSHYQLTGPEIVRQLHPRSIDCFICAIGTGGTLTGVGRYLKNIFQETKIMGVEPEGCDLFHNRFISHKIEAISVGVVPKILDLSLIHSMVKVSYKKTEELRTLLSREFGLFLGISSGANIYAAMMAAQDYPLDATIVTLAPDSGRSYIDNTDFGNAC